MKLFEALFGLVVGFAAYSALVALVYYTIKVTPSVQGILFGLATFSAIVVLAPERKDIEARTTQALFGLVVPVLVTFALSYK